MNEKSISTGNMIQITWLIGNLPEPKWEVDKSKEMARLRDAWNEKWEQKEKQKVLDKINDYKDDFLQVIKTEFYGGFNNAWKKNKKLPETFGNSLIALGSIGTLGVEDLLRNRDIVDDAFIQDIVEIARESKCCEEAAYALLGLELAFKDGRFIPIILDVFDKTFSMRLARHLGKIDWDTRVVESLVRATKGEFLHSIPDGLNYKLVDGLGLLASLSLLEINDNDGFRGMVPNLLQNQELNSTPKLLIRAGDMVVPYLIQGLELENTNARSQAANCLGEIGNKTATKSLIDALENDDMLFVSRVAKALGKMDDPAAIPALLENIDHKSILVRPVISWAIKKLNEQWTPEPFLAVLSSENEKVVLFAINALKKLKSTQAIEPFVKLLDSENKKILKAAKRALKNIK